MMLWYRGRILAQSEYSYEVFICDYGYKVQARACDLMPITDNLANHEDSVTFCSVDIPSIASIDLEETVTLLRELFRSYTKLAASYSEHMAIITLWGSNAPGEIGWDHDWDDLNLKLMSRLMMKSIQYYIDRTQYQYRTNKFRNDDGRDDSFDERQMLEKCALSEIGDEASAIPPTNEPCSTNIAKWDLPSRIDRATISGIVTHIHETGTIFVQIEKDHEIANSLEISITNYLAGKPQCEMGHVWRKSNTCFAKHGEYFRRGIIKSIDRENGTCQIMFVDYGDKVVTRLNNLYAAADILGFAHRMKHTLLLILLINSLLLTTQKINLLLARSRVFACLLPPPY
ncbi:uncharacterized protein LOC129573148 [Sitodiplosis mosellana]|uniref:uncharacterized protein LOC129573148 n=1 Tax=Sitodiplosis mosellana TaxID=263140 RepID=UPI0024438EE6|nr:uncharacterized protein LOC129573148 [Sitodiplosis mosellana]